MKMRKKIIVALTALMVCTSVFGCSSTTSDIVETEEQTDAQLSEFREGSYSVRYIPLTLEYGEGEIVLEKFAAVNTEIDYANSVAAAFVFDLSTLSDKERHYLIEQGGLLNDMTTAVLVSGATDDDESIHLSLLNSSYDDGKYYVLYGSNRSDYERDSLAGRRVTAFVDLRQNEDDKYKSYLYSTEVVEHNSESESEILESGTM